MKNRHIERSQSEVEISTRASKYLVITVAIDLSTAFTSLRAVIFVQDDVSSSTQIRVKPQLLIEH